MGKKKAAAAGAFRCGNLDCNVTGRDKVDKVCAACRAVRYCCRKCQGQHWSSRGGNHRAHCTPPPKPDGAGASAARPAPASPRAPTPAVAAADPEHPCPICLVNEDDHGQCCQCLGCGQLYCGECNVPAKIGRIDNCPTCRSLLRVPAEVDVERLKKLVGRSPGRHTPDAQYNLAVIYYHGSGVPQDHAETARHLKLACDQGHPPARDFLGQLTAQFPAGTRVWIAGLTAAAHLNGRLGTAVTPTRPLAAGRIAVRIDGQTKSMSLSWANVGRVGAGSAPR